MESIILEASNLSSASTDDDDDDDSELFELNEKLRAAEEFSRELKLRNRSETDLESISHTATSNDDDESQNQFQEILLDQNFEESEIQAEPAEKISIEVERQITKNTNLESNLSTASVSDGKESLEQSPDATESVEVQLKLIKRKHTKSLKSSKPDLHKLLIEKSLKQKNKKSALHLKSEEELSKTTGNINLESNASTSKLAGDDRAETNLQKEQNPLERNSKCNLKSSIREPDLHRLMFHKILHQMIKKSEINEECTLVNIDGKSSSDVNDNTFLEDQLEENILNKKLRAAKKFERKLKQKNITSQNLSPAAGGEWNSKFLKDNPDLHKLLGDNSKILDGNSEEDALDVLNKAQSVNLHRQAFLSNWQKCIENLLQKNLDLQELLSNTASLEDTRKIQWNVYTTSVFGMPYFKDKDKTMSCPTNADSRLRAANNHPLIPARDDCGRWTPKETSKLKSSVQEILRDKIIAYLSIEIDEFRKSNDGKKKAAPSKQRNQIDSLNRRISKVKAMSLMELMSETSIDHDYDWQAISLNTFKGLRSPSECQGYFTMCLDPNLNHDKWTKEQNEKLLLLADKYCCQDWDAIATDLGTNHSAYQCCLHFEKELDRNVRAVGKWTSEEDSKLIEAVRTFRVGNHIPWTKVSFSVTTRSVATCRNRWIESLAPHRKKGRFTDEEDKLIVKAIEEHGRSYRAVAAMFPNRTALQIRGRYQRKIENTNIRGRWSPEEDQLLLQLIEKIGVGNWKKISEHLTTRTRTQVRQRYGLLKSFAEQYPNLEFSEIHQRVFKKSKSGNTDDKVTPKSKTVRTKKSTATSSVAKSQTEKSIADTADVSGDQPAIRKTRKRQSEFTGSSRVDNIKTSLKQTDDTADVSEDQPTTRKTRQRKLEVTGTKSSSVDNIKPPLEQTDDTADVSEDQPNTRKRKLEVTESSSVDEIKPPLKQSKTSGTASDDQSRFDKILKTMKKKPHQKTPAGRRLISYFQETYPMQAVVGKKTWDETANAKVIFDLIHILRIDFSYIDDLSRLRSAKPYLFRITVNKLIENHGNELLRLNPVTGDHQSDDVALVCDLACDSDATSSLLDIAPLPVEETLCPDPFPGDVDDPVQCSPHEEDEKMDEADGQMSKPDKQMERQLELIRTKKKQFMEFPFLVPLNVATAVAYRSLLLIERKLKGRVPPSVDPDEDDDDDDLNATLPPDYTTCEFRSKDEDRVRARDNQLDLDKCIRFTKQEAIHMFEERLKILFAGPIVMGECADRYFNVNNLPFFKEEGPTNIKTKRRTTSDHYQELQQSRMASLANKISQDIQIELGGTTETPYSMPSLNWLDNCEPSTSTLFDDCEPSTLKLFGDCQPSTSRSEKECQPSTSNSVNNCNPSSLGESNSALADKQCPMTKRKSPVKTKNSASKTLNFSQPATSKSENCKPSTSRSLGPSVKKE